MIEINDQLSIPESELDFVSARSSGPGGQNVNKVETKVMLLFDVMNSPSLSDEQKQRIGEQLATRMSKKGVLRVISQRHRTQGANRDAVIERFAELLREALEEQVPRRKTRIPRRTKEQRLANKQRRGRVKEQRSKVRVPNDDR